MKQETRISIIVAIIGVIALVTSIIINTSFILGNATPTVVITASPKLVYQVHVEEQDLGHPIANSRVILEVDGKASVIGTTDSNGLVVLIVEPLVVGQTAQLIVEASGYQVNVQTVELKVGGVPDVIRLQPNPS